MLWNCSHDATTIGGRIILKTADTYVRARIDSETKEQASEALAAMGLSISDAIRLLMLRVVDERRLPFEVKAPNAATRKAIAELEAGRGKRFPGTAALIADLNEDD
jgi:DNA-damage-inducible protein J